MSALKEIEVLGLNVGWKTALVGWDGPTANQRQIDGHQVVEFAVEKLLQSPSLAGDTLRLASLEDDDVEEVDRLLRRLAHQERSSEGLEIRKWRIFLLRKVLSGLPEYPLDAWLALAGFWHSFDNPKDSPKIVREFDKIPPDERYTSQMRQRLLSDHQKWLEEELSAVSSSDLNAPQTEAEEL